MLELTDNQIADLRVLAGHCAELRAEFVVIGAFAYISYIFPVNPGTPLTSISPAPTSQRDEAEPWR